MPIRPRFESRDVARQLRRAFFALTAALVVASLAGLLPANASDGARLEAATPPERGAQAGPNFVVITVDDQALNTFTPEVMPKTFRWFSKRKGGTAVPNGFAVPPLCCPSRAGFQTGQLPHNHGVYSNRPGFPMFEEPDNQIASWLDAAGYRTGFAGKYMNGYGTADPAAGYDRWWGVVGKPAYTDYTISVDGEERDYEGRGEYITNEVGFETRQFIKRYNDDNHPFFFWASHYAPHNRRSGGECSKHAQPLPRDLRRIRRQGIELPRGPSFNEADVSDKSEATRQPRMSRRVIKDVELAYECAAGAMRAVDRTVGRTFKTLVKTGLDRSTVVVFVSDNGYYYGEHRLPRGKGTPFDPSVHVPMAISIPRQVLGEKPVGELREDIANIDLAPTFLELAGEDPCTSKAACRVMDGRSLVGVLGGSDPTWPRNREFLLEIRDGCNSGYRSLRNERHFYVEYYKGDPGGPCELAGRELYNLKHDPDELDNLLADGGDRVARRKANAMAARMRSLADCNGIEGRDEPSDVPFCE